MQAPARIRSFIKLGLQSAFVMYIAFGAISCGKTPSTSDRFDGYLAEAAEVWGFQGAALVARDGEVLISKGYGAANIANDVPNKPNTKFLLGSMTKQFTATAIMQLVEKGQVKLDDPITEYLPDYPPETGNTITIHHLLSHTSGVPNHNRELISLMQSGQPVTPEELMATFRDLPLDFAPGEKYSYSNCGYVVLGAIIEHVSGQSYDAYLQEHIFGPLGMSSTGVYPDFAARPDFATGYQQNPAGDLIPAQPFHISIGFSAGSVSSTVEDLFRWDQALYTEQILSRNSVEKMFTPNFDDYGYGWLTQTAFGRTAVGHGGGTPGFTSWLERWPDDSVFVVVFSNNVSAPAFTIGRGLAAIALGEPVDLPAVKTPIDVHPNLLNTYVGMYKIKDGQFRTITFQNGGLYSQRAGGPPMKILPETENRFFFAHDHTATLEFVGNSDGHVTGAVLRLIGSESTEERVDHPPDR